MIFYVSSGVSEEYLQNSLQFRHLCTQLKHPYQHLVQSQPALISTQSIWIFRLQSGSWFIMKITLTEEYLDLKPNLLLEMVAL